MYKFNIFSVKRNELRLKQKQGKADRWKNRYTFM